MTLGRPRVAREPNERVPLSLRIRGALFNELSSRAAAHDRPLGNEIELILEKATASDEVLTPEQKWFALEAIAAFFAAFGGGEGGIVRLLMRRDEPDDDERRWRFERIRGALLNEIANNPIPGINLAAGEPEQQSTGDEAA